MEKIIVGGKKKLDGEVSLQGSKNSVLPILAATLLSDGESVLHNSPRLTDVGAAIDILRHLGCRVNCSGAITVDAGGFSCCDIPENMMNEMRSSIIFLGSLLGSAGCAEISMPGGCDIGLRPIDLHLDAMRRMGAVFEEQGGRLKCTCPDGLHAALIPLSFPSVGATENIMLAAVRAKGTTTVVNAAREPEIIDLASYLNSCGAKISGAGEGTIVIEGVKRLKAAEHRVISDRIVAATYLAAVACAGGRALLKGCIPGHLAAVSSVFEQSGCTLREDGENMLIEAPERLNSVGMVRTMPYPGFPTDAQAVVMSMLCKAKGTSLIVETVFENRFKTAGELARMGACIKVEGRVAVVEGVDVLHGANVRSTDLRGGGALVAAALGAEGTTEIYDIHHIDRGYESLENNLSALGANIRRED